MRPQLRGPLAEKPKWVPTFFSDPESLHTRAVKGLFAGVSLDGSVVSIDDDANLRVYGKDLTGEQILLDKGVRTNGTVKIFMQTLEKVSPADVHQSKS
jgi:cytoskeletal protein CcmA (bactofilin family)